MNLKDKVPENPGEEMPKWVPSSWIMIPLFVAIVVAFFILVIKVG